MKLLSAFSLFLCFSCLPDKPKAFYEIVSEGEINFQVASFHGEPYYWEWANQENVKAVKLTARVFQNQRLVHKIRGFGTETWTFEGTQTGTDTLRIYLRTFEEDTLNVPVIDSLIIAVKVN